VGGGAGRAGGGKEENWEGRLQEQKRHMGGLAERVIEKKTYRIV
jgi:hypothetical protein